MTAFVSIITPVYNSQSLISEAIKSVKEQTFENWEMILVDDCSSDDSIKIIEPYLKDKRIKLVQLNKNSGAAVARNTAIETAKGDFIAFLDADDTWHPSKLERQIAFMQERDIAFSYTQYHRVNENGEIINTVKPKDKVNYYDMLKTSQIGCLTAMYDIRKLGKTYMPLIRKRQDLGLWLKILKTVDYAYCLEETLAYYTVQSNSVSSNKRSAAQYQWRLYRKAENLSLIKASYYFIHYAINGLIKTKY